MADEANITPEALQERLDRQRRSYEEKLSTARDELLQLRQQLKTLETDSAQWKTDSAELVKMRREGEENAALVAAGLAIPEGDKTSRDWLRDLHRAQVGEGEEAPSFADWLKGATEAETPHPLITGLRAATPAMPRPALPKARGTDPGPPPSPPSQRDHDARRAAYVQRLSRANSPEERAAITKEFKAGSGSSE